MLTTLRAHGFRTLYRSEVTFAPLTILLGKNGVGKTALLDVIQTIGKFARGGVERAFGPPPWSLGWQRTKGFGNVVTTDFELALTTPTGDAFEYVLRLGEHKDSPEVKEEALLRLPDRTRITTYDWQDPPQSGTILRPNKGAPRNPDIDAVASILTSFESYELNPAFVERGNDPTQTQVARNGFGVAGYLANLHDTNLDRFQRLEAVLKRFRPDTEALRIWGGDELFWGILDKGQKHPFAAVHLSWGDRVLVGLLCVLFSAPANGTIAIEEIDRGFHPSRYRQIIELLTEVAYDGVFGEKTQIIITTHSPSFVNKLQDLHKDIRLVTRASSGPTLAKPLDEVMRKKLGSDSDSGQPLGDIWEMGLLEDRLDEIMQ